MRCVAVFVFFATLLLSEAAIFSGSTAGSAQSQISAQEKAASLRSQLTEVEAKQTELQNRLQNLDDAIKPENIEKVLAGVGSTRPEDLREQRRRELEIERNGVRAQLDLLATSHTRLEAAVARADAEAYRQSAAPVIATTVSTSPVANAASASVATTGTAKTPKSRRRIKKRRAKPHD